MSTTRVAMMALLCGGAAAQQVLLDGQAVSSWAVGDALGKPFGGDGTVAVVPSYIASLDGEYHHVGAYDGTLTFAPGAGAAGQAPTPATDKRGRACGMGWAKGLGESTCFSEIEDLKTNKWGWTNVVNPGETQNDVPIYIGAAQCRGGKVRAHIQVTYTGTTITIDLGSGLRAAHVWVGKNPDDVLPRGPNGALSAAPGQFPVKVNVNDDPVVTFEADGTSAYRFAVHVNTCGADATPAPACPSTFMVHHYVCSNAGCDATAANGDLAAKLVAGGWTNTGAVGLCFTTPASDFYRQYTNVLVKELTESEDAPAADGTVNYIGVTSLGCGKSYSFPDAEPNHGNGGPAKFTCGDFCLGAAAAFGGQ